jgi:Bacterial Ig-like domain (group 2)
MRNPTPVLAFVCLSLLAGCGGGGGSSPIVAPGSGTGTTQQVGAITQSLLTPTNPTLEVGRTIVLTALGSDKNGVTVSSSTWTWSSSDTSTVSVDATGDHATITANKIGTATITAKETKTGVLSAVLVTVVAQGASGNTGGTPGVSSGGNGNSGTGAGSGAGTGTGTGSTNSGTPPAGGTGNVGNPGNGGTGGAAGSTTVYSNDFTGAIGSEWSSTLTDTTPGTAKRPPTKFLGQFGPQTVSLSLASLPAHSTTTIEFDLFIIRSMDGNTADGVTGPDAWDLSVTGGPTLVHTSFSNTYPAANGFKFPNNRFQAYPDAFPGGVHEYQTGAAEISTLGYIYTGFPEDSVYHLKYTFPNTASSLQFKFTSLQNQPVTDESWGLKNVKVSTNP